MTCLRPRPSGLLYLPRLPSRSHQSFTCAFCTGCWQSPVISPQNPFDSIYTPVNTLTCLLSIMVRLICFSSSPPMDHICLLVLFRDPAWCLSTQQCSANLRVVRKAAKLESQTVWGFSEVRGLRLVAPVVLTLWALFP